VVAVTGPDASTLVLRHRYRHGLADESGHGNDGYRSGPRVFVPPSPSLTRAGAFRVRVAATARELGQRRTLVEGYLSFALFVERDGSLGAGVLDRGGWTGLHSAPETVAVDAALEIVFDWCRDGVLGLWLDDRVVAQGMSAPNGAHGLSWPFGLSIGAWPDADLRTWQGSIDEVVVWRASDAT
jgi:hypothetical protein